MTAKRPRRKTRVGKTAARRVASARRRAVAREPASNEPNVHSLLHELQIHSEEITVQNEQLLKAQAELEQARDRYADLYDFAPIGYLQIDARANIADVNLAGAELVDRPRSFMIGMPLSAMFVTEHLAAVREFLLEARLHADHAILHTEARVRRRPERVLRLMARPLSSGKARTLLVALLDVTDERRLEADRTALLEREQDRAAELARAVEAARDAETRVKTLLQRLVTVQEQERRRIARNLHDQLGQQMTALRLTIAAAKATASAEALQQRLDAIERIAIQIDKDVDDIAWDLRPAALDDVGLHGALQTLVQEWSASRNIEGEFHVSEPNAIRLTSDIESHLYRIVQEALNNVAKHAQATHVAVLLERRGHDVLAIVEDNGKGFDVAGATEKGGGMGLLSMQERAALVGGEFQVESAPGKGTTLVVRMPVYPAIQRRMARKRAKDAGV